jgi:hypothetical protein
MPRYRFLYTRMTREVVASDLAQAYTQLIDKEDHTWGQLQTVECGVMPFPKDAFELSLEDMRYLIEPDYQPYSPASQYDPGTDACAWVHRLWYKQGDQWIEIRDPDKALLPATREWLNDQVTERLVG